MNLLPRRNRQKNAPRHALAAVRDAQAPETADPGETFNAAPAAAPTCDDTILFRIPAADGGPGFVIPPGSPWSTSQDTLRDVRDALQALPVEPRHAEAEAEDAAPEAYLRAVVPGGDTGVTQIQDALGHSPRFAGSGLLADGRPVAGMYLGTNEDGWFVLDALTPEWCDDAIAALEEMRDSLLASEQAEDGEAA